MTGRDAPSSSAQESGEPFPAPRVHGVEIVPELRSPGRVRAPAPT